MGPGTREGRGTELSPRPIRQVCPGTPVLTPRAHLFQVDPDIEARATIEKRDLHCLQVVGDVPVSLLHPGAISGQVHLFNPFWMVIGENAVTGPLTQNCQEFFATCSLPGLPGSYFCPRLPLYYI